MFILKFLRNYYLYFYFHTTELKKEGDEPAFPFNGFVATMLLVVSFNVMAILFSINALVYEFVNDFLLIKLFSFRGDVNLLFIIILLISLMVTYLICCYKITYSDVQQRLCQKPWFSERSVVKLLFLAAISMFMCVMSGVLFY